MADTFETGVVAAERGFLPFPQGTIGVRRATFDTAVAPNTADVYRMIPVFKDEIVVNLFLIIPKIPDINATEEIVFDVGDGLDPNRYIDGADTDFPEGGFQRMGQGIVTAAAAANLFHQYTADDTIDITIAVDPATDVVITKMELVAFIGN